MGKDENIPEDKRDWEVMKVHFEVQPPSEAVLRSHLGEAIMCWNNMENIMREVLIKLCGLKAPRDVLTAELTADGISNALRAAANLFAPEYVRDEIIEAAKKMDEYRPYRNDLVHGCCNFAPTTDGQLGIQVKNKSAKSAVKIIDTVLSAHQLYMISEAFNQLALLAFEIWSALSHHGNKEKPGIQLQKFAFPQLDLIPRQKMK